MHIIHPPYGQGPTVDVSLHTCSAFLMWNTELTSQSPHSRVRILSRMILKVFLFFLLFCLVNIFLHLLISAKEIQLMHRAPVVGIVILDGHGIPLPEPLEVAHDLARSPDMHGLHHLLVISEEQFKVTDPLSFICTQ